MTDICTNCRKEMICEAEAGKCWCMKYPSILSVEENKNCLCDICLKEKIQVAIHKYVEEVELGERINDAFKYANSSTNILEGIDYYLENGLFVFTAWYHLKRGRCCNNGCRHCPYKKSSIG